ncbi:MAG: hypothetical protein ACR2ID_07735 [Chthoniobacterales bacterium]
MRSRALLLSALLCVFAGCDRTGQQLSGRWQVEGGNNPLVWEFSPGGGAKMGRTAARYTLGDGERLKIQTPSATFVYKMRIAGDTMTWADPNGSQTTLKKIP